MKHQHWPCLWLIVLGSCRSDPGGPPAPAVTSAAPLASQTVATSPQATLDQLDAREPVPLLPMMANHQKQNMRDHLAVVQEIVAAVAKQDFVGVQKSVARIGYTERMGQMCTHMGTGSPGFTDAALAFHHSADEIGAAAARHDAGAVLAALSKTLAHCTSCHATYKQRVVDDATWSALAGAPHPRSMP